MSDSCSLNNLATKVMKKLVFGILGGGREGLWWKRFLEAMGHTVLVSDCAEDNASVIAKSDVLIIATPMSVSVQTARQVARLGRAEQLVISVCGLMMKVEKALGRFKGEIVFFHRMIGTQVATMKGHTMIVNRVKLRTWSSLVRATVRDTEAIVIKASSKEHDEMVGLTQAIARIIMLALGLVALKAPLPVKAFANVPFTGLMAVLARIVDFGHLLSRDMVFENPFCRKWIMKLHIAMLRIESGKEDFEKLFTRLSRFLGVRSVKAGSQALAQMPPWWN